MEKPLSIDRVWMAVQTDEEGNEGVCAVMNGDMWVPLIAADPARLANVRAQAQVVADHTGKPVKLIELATRSETEEFKPL